MSKLLKFKKGYSLLLLILIFALFYLGVSAMQVSGQSFQDKESSWFIDIKLFSNSAHTPLACEDCHKDMYKNDKAHPDTEASDFLQQAATRKFDYSICESCHMFAYKRYQKGAHAEALKEDEQLSTRQFNNKALKERGPTCGNCHAVHYQPPGLNRVQSGKRMLQVCGDCHPEHAKSYLKDFHGRAAVDLENEDSAYCTDCHGAHLVKALDEQEQALTACKRCHLQAKEKFTNYIVHASLKSQKDQEDNGQKDNGQDKLASMYFVSIVKGIVFAAVILVLVFFFGLSLLWMLRELHEKLRKH